MSIPEQISGISLGSAYVRPGDVGPITSVTYIAGGWITVESTASLLDIDQSRTSTGQIAYISESQELYIAKKVPADWITTFEDSVVWDPFSFPGGSGFPFSGSAVITGSLTLSGSFVDFTNATVISGSIFSGSFVGDGSGLTGIASSFRISGSSGNVLVNLLDESLLLTGSLQDVIVTITDHTASFSISDTAIISGSFSGSFEGLIDHAVSASYAATASYVESALTASYFTGSHIDFTPLPDSAAPSHRPGRVWYDSENGALAVYNDEADITLQVGQEFYKRVYNNSDSIISNGTPVRISGSQGDVPYVWPALADDITTVDLYENHLIGVATHDIAINETGYVTEMGIVRGVDTSDFSAGQILYLQTGSAGFRNTPPPFPYETVQVGHVVRSAANGFIEVKVVEPVHFGIISGLSGSSPAKNHDLWVYDSSNSAWYNTHSGLSLSGSFSGSFAGNITNAITASYAITSSFAATSLSASHALYADESLTASYALKAESVGVLDQNVTILGGLTVYGTSSFVTVTSSRLDVDYAWISVNVFEPAERFAGLRIYDSGSLSHQATASLAWDSTRNHFVYLNASGSTYAGGGLMSGPRNTGSLGDEQYPKKDYILRGQGGDHLYDANITDNDSFVSVKIPLQITGSVEATENFSGSFIGDGSGLTGVAANPAGDDKNVQFKSGSITAGAQDFVYDHTNKYVGIGSVSPGAKLDVNGIVRVNNEIHFSDSAMRIFRTGDEMRLRTNSTDRITIKSNGNVGIGVTVPDSRLHVAGNVKFQDDLTISGSSPSITFLDTNPVSGSDAAFIGTGGRKMTIYTGRHNKSRNDLWLRVGDNANSSTPTIFASGSNGFIGLGTETPSQRLTVQGNISASGLIYAPNIGAGVDNSVVVLDSDGTLRTDEIDGKVWAGNLVDGSGTANRVAYWSDSDTLAADNDFYFNGTNVGVGTTSPESKFHIYDTTQHNATYTASLYIQAYGSVDQNNRQHIGGLFHSKVNGSSNVYGYGVVGIADKNGSFATRMVGVQGIGRLSGTNQYGGGISVVGVEGKIDTIESNTAYRANTTYALYSTLNALSGSTIATHYGLYVHTGNREAGSTITNSYAIVTEPNAGNVGIGTLSPSQKLHIAGTTLSTGGYRLNNGTTVANINAGGSILFDSSANIIIRNAGNTEYVRFEASSGNVGIGTTSPLNKLHVYHATTNEVVRFESGDPTVSIRLKDNNASGYISSGYGNLELHSDIDGQIADSKMYFKIDNSEKMRLQANGHLGIGTTAPESPLHVVDGTTVLGSQPGIIAKFENPTDGRTLIRVQNNNTSVGAAASAAGISIQAFSDSSDQPESSTHEAQILLRAKNNSQDGDLQVIAPRSITLNVDNEDTVMTGSGYHPVGTAALYISSSGAVQLSQYGSGTFTGTAAYTLRIDSSGNIIEDAIGSGAVDGAGAANQVAVWKDTDTVSGSGALTWNGSVLNVEGTLEATEKSFVINHPTQEGKKLVYGVLEGPEHGVYCRGKISGEVIELPEEWTGLVDEDTITVQLTSIGKHQNLYVADIRDNKIFIKNGDLLSSKINAFYYIQGTRKDVKPLVTVRDK